MRREWDAKASKQTQSSPGHASQSNIELAALSAEHVEWYAV